MADSGHPTALSLRSARQLPATTGKPFEAGRFALHWARRILLMLLGIAMAVSVFSLPFLLFLNNDFILDTERKIAALVELIVFFGAAYIWWRTSASEVEYLKAKHALARLVRAKCAEGISRNTVQEEMFLFDETLNAVLCRLLRNKKHGDADAARIVEDILSDGDTGELRQYLLNKCESLQADSNKDLKQYLEVFYQAAVVCYLFGEVAKAAELIRHLLLLKPRSGARVLLLHADILRDEGRVEHAMASYRKLLDLEVEEEDDLTKGIAFENLRRLSL